MAAKCLEYGMTDSKISEIDFDHLNRYVAGDPDLTREVFGMFRNQVDMLSRNLTADAEDDLWCHVTHSLKGSALAVGALKLAKHCERAEDLIGDDRRPGAREVAVESIEYRISQVLAEIVRWEYRDDMNRLRSS